MAFAKWERLVVDEAGNLIDNCYVEVRRETFGLTLAPALYADSEGAEPLSNPFQVTDGRARFYAPGSSYRVRVYSPRGDVALYRDEAVGTAQARDAEVFQLAGLARDIFQADRTIYI